MKRPQIGNTVMTSIRGGSPFSIEHSFLMDGVAEYFTILNAELASYLQGANEFTILTQFRLIDLGHINTLFSCWGGTPSLNLNVSTSGVLAMNLRNSGSNATTATAQIMVDTWYSVVFTCDPTESLGDRAKFYINFVDDTLGDNAPASVDASASNYRIGTVEGISGRFQDGYQSLFAVINQALTPTEVASLEDSCGNFKNPKTLFTTYGVKLYNPDESGDEAQFTMTDGGQTPTTSAVSVAMEDPDKTTETPYGC